MRLFLHFLRSHWQEVLVTGVFVQAVVTALFTGNAALILATSVGGLLLIVLIFQIVASRRGPQGAGDPAFSTPRRGLIFTVGRQKDTINYAIRREKPQYIGFICSQATEFVVADLIIEHELRPEQYKKKVIDPQAIREIQAETELVLEWMQGKGLSDPDIAVDITGGMTTMSVGVFTVAQKLRIDSQYVRSAYDEQNRPIPGSQEAVFVEQYT